ncbi:MAG: type II toxin-antitoxin system VapC family toxin [Candidatus Omnitrophica bacterium]|nr:type II toxin-antitoxin system VapC family toxin [Candidatus Omnitrophota bacterium]
MNIVDSCGWLEYLSDGQNADFFAAAVENVGTLIVPAICIYEVFKRVYEQRGEDAALQAIAIMHQGKVVAVDEVVALNAAKCSLEQRLPLADSLILAIARLEKAVIWTQDEDFKKIPGVKYIPAPQRKK